MTKPSVTRVVARDDEAGYRRAVNLFSLDRKPVPSSGIGCKAALAAIVLALASTPLAAQSPADGAEGLTIVKCGPQTNSCEPQDEARLGVPELGPAGRATVLSPDLRTTELALDSAEYGLLIPGCAPTGPGVFVCDSVHQYQHCRTLMFSRLVYSCRAPNPLDKGFADARPAGPGEYRLEVESSARIRVLQGKRSFGQVRGDAKVVLHMQPPGDVPGGSCLQRDQFLFFPTGPDGGVSHIDDTAACDEPMEFKFEPHEDDIVRAFDACEEFAAWGGEIEETMDVIAAGLFHIRSTDAEFLARHDSGIAIIAPYVTVSAPLTIACTN